MKRVELEAEITKLRAQVDLLKEMLEEERAKNTGVSQPATTLKPVIFGLTTKQQATLQMLMNGRTNGEIAHRLGTDLSTAKVHVRGVFKNFGVKNRHDLVTKVAPSWELIEPSEYRSVTGINKDWDINGKTNDPDTVRIRQSFKKVKDGRT